MRMAALLSLLLLTGTAPPDGERRYMVTGFDRVRVDGPFDVEIQPGSNGASAEGSPAALDRLSIRVSGNTLIVNSGAVGWERRTRDDSEIPKIRITAPLLRGLSTNGGAKIRVAEMRAPRIDLALEGTSSIDVAGIRADELYAANNGMGTLKLAGAAGRARILGGVAGTVDAAGLTARDASLLWESSGTLTIAVRYIAQVTASGRGPVTILGTPHCIVRGTATVTCEGTVERR